MATSHFTEPIPVVPCPKPRKPRTRRIQDGPVEIHRVAIYGRVSTHNQNVDMQLTELREYAAARCWEVASEYVDVGVSGSKESRPELNRLMKDAHARHFDACLTWKLDRLGRSMRHLLNTIEDLDRNRVSFVSIRDNFDLTTPMGRMCMQLLGAMAEFERALIVERVKAGMQNAKRKGIRVGRPRSECSGLRVIELRQAGRSWRAIGTEMSFPVATCIRAAERAQMAAGGAL